MVSSPLSAHRNPCAGKIQSCCFLLLFCLSPSASYAEPDPYAQFIGESIYEVYGEDRPRFKLGKTGKGGIALHGEGKQPYKTLNCEQQVSIEIHSYRKAGNVLAGRGKVGNISASICHYNSANRDFARKNHENMQEILQRMDIDEEAKPQLMQAGGQFSMQQVGLDNDAEMYTFPVIVIGHGMLVARTAFAYPSNNEFVIAVQYILKDIYCEDEPDVQICRNPEGSMKELVQLLLNKWPHQSQQ